MTDYFALLGEARRAWLDPEKLKEKYFALNRATAADAELNEAYRVLSDPKLRLHHLLTLEGAELSCQSASAVVGRGVVFGIPGRCCANVEQWLLRSAEATSTLSRALLSSERTKLEGKLEKLEEQLNALYESRACSASPD
jgi:curved DNA-binding protein CbpA